MMINPAAMSRLLNQNAPNPKGTGRFA